jgi:hypothetical protein
MLQCDGTVQLLGEIARVYVMDERRISSVKGNSSVAVDSIEKSDQRAQSATTKSRWVTKFLSPVDDPSFVGGTNSSETGLGSLRQRPQVDVFTH